MNVTDFNEYAEEFIERERNLRLQKTQEYVTGGTDKYMSAFENFVIQANINGSRIEQEIWNNMIKHIASVKARIQNNHTIPVEKLMDIRAYCLLLAAFAEINLPIHPHREKPPVKEPSIEFLEGYAAGERSERRQ